MVDLTSRAIRQLHELESHIRLVVIHPGYFSQHLLLAAILEDRDAVYVRFAGDQLTAEQLNLQLEDALQSQMGSGRQKRVGSLVLDECDRAAAAEFDTFVPKLLTRFPHGRVYVVSRIVPDCTVSNETVRAVARFVPADDFVLVWDYAKRDQSTVLLEVRAFGSGRVLVNGRVVDSWDGLLPRSLFFYLVDRGMTTRNDIFLTFWPNLSVREATNVFHVTKRKINEVLGTDLTMYWSGFYRIAPNIQLSYDAVQLSELVQNSAVEPTERASELLSQAIALYRGNFLTSLASDWIKKRREELLQTYVEALMSLARVRDKANAPSEALGLYLRAAAITPQREDLASSIMSLYRSLGMPTDALAIYARLEHELKDSLGIAPPPAVRSLADAIRKEVGKS